MKKIISVLISTLIGCSVFAQVVSDKNILDRDIILNKKMEPIHIGWLVGQGKTLDIKKNQQGVLSFSNYLSNKVDSLFVFELDNSEIELISSESDMDLLYVSALGGLPLLNKEFNYVPLVAKNNTYKNVILHKKTNELNDIKQLKGKKIVAHELNVSTMYAKYELIQGGVLKNMSDLNFEIKKDSLLSLVQKIKSNEISALSVTEELGKELLFNNADLAYMPLKTKIPENILFLKVKDSKKSITKEKIMLMKSVLLEFNTDIANKGIKTFIGNVKAGESNFFTEVNSEDLEIAKEIEKLISDKK